MVFLRSIKMNGPVVRDVPHRFFDAISASYYVTDDFSLSVGHVYTFGTHFAALRSECGVALSGGGMASLFADGLIGERGNNAILGGIRIYFGQHDKSLINRHRQDDPAWIFPASFYSLGHSAWQIGGQIM
jgi:hypothetical protein